MNNLIQSHYHIDKFERLVGFAANNVKGGEYLYRLVRAAITSDSQLFYKIMDSISDSLIVKLKIPLNVINRFLFVIHNDLAADLYVNNFELVAEMSAKRAIEKGEAVYLKDIGDISKLRFNDIKLSTDDCIIFCFRVGWKFGLFFDFGNSPKPGGHLDIGELEKSLGSFYGYLQFQTVYDSMASNEVFKTLVSDGWFPFIGLIGGDYEKIVKIYENNLDIAVQIASFINRFEEKRIDNLVAKWWNKPLFNDKRAIIEAGIESYLKDTSHGYIQCIKTLYPEIEGIMRLKYFADLGNDQKSSSHLIDHIEDLITERIKSPTSLYFPKEFAEYLKKIIFPRFDLATGKIDLSRHTSSHGVARADDYTKIKAFQTIFILNQLYFYL